MDWNTEFSTDRRQTGCTKHSGLAAEKKRKNEKNRKTLSIDSAQPAAQEKEHIWNANDLSAQLLMTFIHRLASR
jgi:hypothetical protein